MMVMATCTICGGPLELLGTLGNLTHSRCRDCGAQHSERAEPYTDGERKQLDGLLADACEAEELFDLDELERSAGR